MKSSWLPANRRYSSSALRTSGVAFSDRLGDAGGLQRASRNRRRSRASGKRDRIDPVALARLHGDKMLAFEPQQGLTHRLAADGIAFRRAPARAYHRRARGGRLEYQTAGFRRRLSRKSIAISLDCDRSVAVVKYHVSDKA